MRLIIPGIVKINQCSRVIVPVSDHAVACHLDHNRPSGIDLLLVILKGKPTDIA